MTTKTIDYLYEDPEIPNQKYGLVSIVGPHMPQKCNVWGLKVRGVAESIEKAKAMTQKLMRMDDNYDIYTVEIGKFFPLNVEPYDVKDMEYQNTQLNDLIKSYLQNKELANEQWEHRKNEMMKQALKEGQSQEKSLNDHPVAVLDKIRKLELQIKETQDNLELLQNDLNQSSTQFSAFTEEEKQLANDELKKVIDQNLKPIAAQGNSIEDIRKDLVNNLQISDTLQNIKSIEEKLETNENKTSKQNLLELLEQHKSKLLEPSAVNAYINSNYKESQFSHIDNNVLNPNRN